MAEQNLSPTGIDEQEELDFLDFCNEVDEKIGFVHGALSLIEAVMNGGDGEVFLNADKSISWVIRETIERNESISGLGDGLYKQWRKEKREWKKAGEVQND